MELRLVGATGPVAKGVEPMGRGRAKAKQAKVARKLKYQTGGTSIEALREELGAAPNPTARPEDDVDNEFHDPYDEGDDDPYDEDIAQAYAHDTDDHGELKDANGEGDYRER